MNNKYLLFVVVFLIPILVVSFKIKTNYFILNNNKKIINKIENNKSYSYKEEIEKYLIGVVACEMPASFDIEALKAQAVAARTFAYKRKKYNTLHDNSFKNNGQCYITKKQMKLKWNNKYNKYYSKIKKAVYLTKGEVIIYNHSLINAYYFAMSNGYTEDSKIVFNHENEYLKVKKSNWEINRKDFISKKQINIDQFCEKLGIENKSNLIIKNIKYTNSNRIKSLEINNKKYSGIKIRKLLDLKSTDFTIKQNNNTIEITTRGYGHGVGLSQYGSNGMANEGKNYKEILYYYYNNTKITNCIKEKCIK